MDGGNGLDPYEFRGFMDSQIDQEIAAWNAMTNEERAARTKRINEEYAAAFSPEAKAEAKNLMWSCIEAAYNARFKNKIEGL